VRRALALALFLTIFPLRATIAADGRTEGIQLHEDHPTWLLPAWTNGGPAVWTEVGAPYAASVALIAADGSFAPRNHGPAVTLWLFDADAVHLLVPAEQAPGVRLDDNYLPIVTNAWDAGDVHVETTFFADDFAGSEQAATFIRLTVSTSSQTPRRLAAFLALRPFGVERDIHAIGVASCEASSASLVADGSLVLSGLQPATDCGASSFAQGDVSTFAAGNHAPRPTVVADPAERAEAMLRFAFAPASGSPSILEFRAPLNRVAPGPVFGGASFDTERARVAGMWRDAVSHTTLDVSDARLNNAFRASQAYLLLNRSGAVPRSGPLAHDAFWVRDAAYIGQALERVGYSAENLATLEALLTTQRDDGSFPAITDARGSRVVDEWDAPGQAIGALVAHYRFAHDRDWLARVYPSIARAAGFIDALRGRTLTEEPETRSLMPANISAEDLGSASWHHYWDDLWAIAGYREAAFAALSVGQTSDATEFSARADDLQRVVLDSVGTVQARTGIRFVPNGPEDVVTSAMARGTTPAVWPIRSLQGVPAADLLRGSFSAYFRTWLEPQNGGYRHVEDTLWPYGGLGIAHAMLRLGMLERTHQVLDWTLGHQTLPGTYAWGEAINARTGGLELGDMPHSWAAAELISLLRDMIVAEQDGALLVNSGAPDSWLLPGEHIILKNAPTEYGSVNISLVRSDTELTIRLDGVPPAGWRVRLPGRPDAVLPSGSQTLVVRSAT
jgi:hypothetical protein